LWAHMSRRRHIFIGKETTIRRGASRPLRRARRSSTRRASLPGRRSSAATMRAQHASQRTTMVVAWSCWMRWAPRLVPHARLAEWQWRCARARLGGLLARLWTPPEVKCELGRVRAGTRLMRAPCSDRHSHGETGALLSGLSFLRWGLFESPPSPASLDRAWQAERGFFCFIPPGVEWEFFLAREVWFRA